jgi:TRAP-type C4-dicarboxylate transport system permease small subunit
LCLVAGLRFFTTGFTFAFAIQYAFPKDEETLPAYEVPRFRIIDGSILCGLCGIFAIFAVRIFNRRDRKRLRKSAQRKPLLRFFADVTLGTPSK